MCIINACYAYVCVCVCVFVKILLNACVKMYVYAGLMPWGDYLIDVLLSYAYACMYLSCVYMYMRT